MILLGSGVINFSTAQWTQLYAYQSAHQVRLVSFFDVPGAGAAAGFTAAAAGAFGGAPASLVPADAGVASAAGLPSSFQLRVTTGAVYGATVLNASAVTPVLNFTTSDVAACIYTFAPTQEQLSFFYQTAAWDLLSSPKGVSDYTNEIWISWASRGVYSIVPVLHAAEVQTRALIL
ncbi:hypothetical protein BDR26DRAFT_67679 [Obelidium mucronatum]|nr:hypothetical protein BDR26DRAFT_67679 [Obelidium mucronatum]